MNPTSPSLLLRQWGRRPKKSLGQHFLSDRNIPAAIVKRAGLEPIDAVVEIGAGLGALTLPLAREVKSVIAVEPDRQIAEILRARLSDEGVTNVSIIERSILDCDMRAFADAAGASLKVLGNLPYHISSQVLVHLIGYRECVEGAVLMFQKELADRLLAGPGTKAYGRLSVLIQYSARVRRLLHVPSSAFFPRPKVDSEVVGITFYDRPPVASADEVNLFRVVAAAFGKRRKTLQNALLKGNLGCPGPAPGGVARALALAGIEPRRRAETLSVEDFVRLADHLREQY